MLARTGSKGRARQRRASAKSGRRGLFLAALVVVTGSLAVPTAAGAFLASYTWTGASAEKFSYRWSASGNWQSKTAPSGKVGTLTFPKLPSAEACSSDPFANCWTSENDVTGIEAEALVIDLGAPYDIFDHGLALGSGGVTATTSGTEPFLFTLFTPLALSASQTWTVDGGSGGSNHGFLRLGQVQGETKELAINLSNAATVEFCESAQVGAVTAKGSGTLLMRSNCGSPSLNGQDGKAVTLSGGTALVAFDDTPSIGPLTTDGPVEVGHGAFSTEVPDAVLSVDGGMTLSASSTLTQFIDHSGSGTGAYSQIKATGSVSLASAHLTLGLGHDFTKLSCPVLKPGDVDTLITTTGALTGTFSGISNGATIPLSDCGSSELAPPTVTINYTAHSVTATIVTAGEGEEGSKEAEEEAKRKAEEETAAKHKAEEETAAKHKAEEETAAKRKAEEEAAAKHKAEEETAAKHKAEEQAAARRKAEEETAAKHKAEEEALSQVASALAGWLSPHGKLAKLRTILKRDGYAFAVTAPLTGALTISWYQLPKGAHLTAHKPVLVASGSVSLSAANAAKITLKLTSVGKRLLKHAQTIKLTARGIFSPRAAAPIARLRSFTLKR
jgi:hypothetical protein